MDDNKYHKLYETDDRFKRYVDMYCKIYGLTVMDALAHRVVQNVGKEYQTPPEVR